MSKDALNLAVLFSVLLVLAASTSYLMSALFGMVMDMHSSFGMAIPMTVSAMVTLATGIGFLLYAEKPSGTAGRA